MSKLNIIVLCLIFNACSENKLYEKERIQMLQESTYDEGVFHTIEKYTVLKNIILENLDSIILPGKRDASFNYNYNDRKFQPGLAQYIADKEIVHRFNSVFLALGKNLLKGIKVHRDSSMTFMLRQTYLPDYRSDIREHLFYKKRKTSKNKSPFMKDTTFQNWTYRIWVDKRNGW